MKVSFCCKNMKQDYLDALLFFDRKKEQCYYSINNTAHSKNVYINYCFYCGTELK